MRRRPIQLPIALVLVALTGLWLGAQSSVQVGYALITADPGRRTPAASALFTFTNAAGVLVSEAGVGTAEPIPRGRIFVDEAGTRTGVVFVNSSSSTAQPTLILRDPDGREISRQSLTIAPQNHFARYIDEIFTSRPQSFRGSLAFETDVPVAALTLREIRNGFGEPLYTTLPVINADTAATTTPAAIPHVAVGGGYSTQVILLNTTAAAMRGQIVFRSSSGSAMSVRFGGSDVTTLPYAIAAHGAFRAEVAGGAAVAVGWAEVAPDAGTSTPAGTAVFQLKNVSGHVVTEAGVPAPARSPLVRLFVDNAGTRTGVALANPLSTPADLVFRLIDSAGVTQSTVPRTLPPMNHLAVFAHELFPALTEGFNGILEISGSGPFAALTLKLTTNTRGDVVLTTLPVADLAAAAPPPSLVFPHLAIGGEFSTRLIFINGDRTSGTSGTLTFRRSDGSAMVIPLGTATGSQFPVDFSAGGGAQLAPGPQPARVSSITLIDPATGSPSSEVAVNAGETTSIQTRIVDSAGQVRTDIGRSYGSLNPEIATVDSSGVVRGLQPGFSTLTITAGGVIAVATITVVRVDAGVSGFNTYGVAQDVGGRLYLAAAQDHTVLRVDDLRQTPSLYAGVTASPGLRNGSRADSLFRGPGFLALDQSDGSVYVADRDNHVVRRVLSGASGSVETVAGAGSAGSTDGAATAAQFRSPEGVTLDGRGNLWVVDSGNHTIRRIRLQTGTVETVAGSPGSAGLQDGTGTAARFHTPAGIAVEGETAAQQLQREARGEPVPPVRMIVADTGNNTLRRVDETGRVETITTAAGTALSAGIGKAAATAVVPQALVRLDGPAGVAVDRSGNIFVTEPGVSQIRMVTRNGNVSSVGQRGAFRRPVGITLGDGGRLVVGDGERAAREILFGAPTIAGMTPADLWASGGEAVTLRGTNFAPDSILIVAGIVIADARIENTQTLTFTTPALPSGGSTITVQNRGGTAQAGVRITPVPFSALPAGAITTVAGGSTFVGDGGFAVSARLSDPQSIAVDSEGHIYVADSGNHRIRRIDRRSREITTVAGDGQAGFDGDGGPAAAASLWSPAAAIVDNAGNLYIADQKNHRVRIVRAATGLMATIAGDGRPGFSGDGGAATAASLNTPQSLVLDRAGNLYISETQNHRIRRVAASTGIITTTVGDGTAGFAGDGGPATAARLNAPRGIALDSDGHLLIADAGNHRIRMVDRSTGVITTVLGNGTPGFSGDNGLATAASISDPQAVAPDPAGGFAIADSANRRVRRVNASRIVTTVAGDGRAIGTGTVRTGPALLASLGSLQGIAVDGGGNYLVSDHDTDRVYRVTRLGALDVLAGNGSGLIGDGGPAVFATLRRPQGIAVVNGSLVIVDTDNHRVRVAAAGTATVSTAAGLIPGSLQSPAAVAADAAGNIYVADTDNHRIRRVDASTGVVTTTAGTGTPGFSGDGGPATQAQFDSPTGLLVAPNGDLYVSDSGNSRIRRITGTARTVSTVAGTGASGFSGDGGPATLARLALPRGLATDGLGNLYVADRGNGRVRRISSSTGVIQTVAGPPDAILLSPSGLAFDAAGNLYISEGAGHAVVRVSPSGRVTPIAGERRRGFSGDGGPAAAARLFSPDGLWIDAAGTLFIADRDNGRIRAIRGPIP